MKKLLQWLFPFCFEAEPNTQIYATAEEVKQLLPMKVTVTQQMIDTGMKRLTDVQECIGAQMLMTIFPNTTPKWFWCDGSITFNNGERIYLTTKEGVDIMELTKPKTITLIERQ